MQTVDKAVEEIERLIQNALEHAGHYKRTDLWRIVDDVWTVARAAGHSDGYDEGYTYGVYNEC